MATKAQKNFRKEMKEIRKVNKDYFENNDLYLKRTSSLRRRVVRNVAYTGGGIIGIRFLLFLFVFVAPRIIPQSSNWFGNSSVDSFNTYRSSDYDNYYGGKMMSLEEQVIILDELGITGVTEEMISEIEEFYQQMDAYDMDSFISIIGAIGYGDYDYETNIWTPISSEVYGFDSEVFMLETMYTDFLKGITAISNSEFMITDIVENTDGVDIEKGEGIQTVSFKYNGNPYLFEGKVNNDWMDCSVIDFFNDLLEKENNPNRLWCMFDGGQGYFLFYNSMEWVDKFSEKTGIPLSLSYRY